MNIAETLVGGMLPGVLKKTWNTFKPKNRKIRIETAEQLPERDPIIWVHPDALELGGKKWVDFKREEMPAVGAELTESALNLSAYGVSGKSGRTYRIRVKNNTAESVMVENVAIGVTDVSPSPSGTLVFQVPQGQPDERELWCDILSLEKDRLYDAYVASGSRGARLYRAHPNLSLAPQEIAQLFIQVSAPPGHVFQFDVILEVAEHGKVRSRKRDRLRLTTVPSHADRIYTVKLAEQPDGSTIPVLEAAGTLDDAQNKFFTPRQRI